MKQLVRILPYNVRVVKAVVIDVAEALSIDATRDGDTGDILATVNVFNNKSRVAFDACAVDDAHTKICVSLVSPSQQLSEEGQNRTLNYLADSMEQLLENTFAEEIPV